MNELPCCTTMVHCFNLETVTHFLLPSEYESLISIKALLRLKGFRLFAKKGNIGEEDLLSFHSISGISLIARTLQRFTSTREETFPYNLIFQRAIFNFPLQISPARETFHLFSSLKTFFPLRDADNESRVLWFERESLLSVVQASVAHETFLNSTRKP